MRMMELATMNEHVRFEKLHGIGVITINNPPVNALSTGIPEALAALIDETDADHEVEAVVVQGGGQTFVAGADIRELQSLVFGERKRGAGLLPFLLRIEDSRKPVVIAIQGAALGGGLELAMAGHYRIASRTAKLAQPEVNLGIIPGAGGTQRLPRLVGVTKALEMCVQGDAISAEEALQLGLIDEIVKGELLPDALAFAHRISLRPFRKTRDLGRKLGMRDQHSNAFSAAREAARTKRRGLRAPIAAIEAIEAATQLTFEEGCRVEQKLFVECLYSDQAKALIHIFFAEREAGKIPDIPKDTGTIPIQSVAVIGAGTMGTGIAMVFANAGIRVLLTDMEELALQKGVANIRRTYEASVSKGRMTKCQAEDCLRSIEARASFEGISQVDLVVEAVFEAMTVKKQIFMHLDKICKADAVLATNTSSLDIDEIASATSRPEFVIGLHFFSPAHVMQLLEIVRGHATSKGVIATCMQLSKKLKKTGVLVGNCRGFVGNRMFQPYRREAQFLVEEGADVEAVDQALYEFGMAMGPLRVGDLAGLDIGWRMRKEHRHLIQPGVRHPIAEDGLCELGRYGQKTGMGWYRYDENRRPRNDPEVSVLVREWATKAGIAQREVTAQEIVDRCICALINEGARILEEGIALRPADIDIVYVRGYGFPAHRGGPMQYSETIGLKNIYERILEFHGQHGQLWNPAPLLKKLAEEGGKFSDYERF